MARPRDTRPQSVKASICIVFKVSLPSVAYLLPGTAANNYFTLFARSFSYEVVAWFEVNERGPKQKAGGPSRRMLERITFEECGDDRLVLVNSTKLTEPQ
ncbi:hypothetical protein AVEN_202302-1 [Araneus ventricosus]|uniref:Uncharacterized protein n=1 Tax=Araneus ventricosus TaxID=182803 RepID=A0A4Y2I2R9_ARAVE|nr:hypothetical protein AVEN_202302-1 [Araneus ventricosus]